jgi:hypothetical protein
LSEVSNEDYVTELIKRTARSESVNIIDARSANVEEGNIGGGLGSFIYEGARSTKKLKKKGRAGSLYVEPKISEMVIERSEKVHRFPDSALYLKDRGKKSYIKSNMCFL